MPKNHFAYLKERLEDGGSEGEEKREKGDRGVCINTLLALMESAVMGYHEEGRRGSHMRAVAKFVKYFL